MGDDAPMAGRLFVCATPIGNLGDASPRLREVLAAAGAIACEDTRRVRTLLSALDLPAGRLLSHRLDNEAQSVRGVLQVLVEEGLDVALVSDAGTPAVADPGVPLVRAALDAGVEVVAVPGPSALAAALSVAGASARRHVFVGFLPRQAAELESLAVDHAHDVVVGFESPARTAATLAVVAGVQPARRVVLCRELTKLHEEVVAGDASQLAARLDGAPVRGEVVLVLDALPQAQLEGTPPRALALARSLVEAGLRPRPASRIAAGHEGGSARELYDLLTRG